MPGGPGLVSRRRLIAFCGINSRNFVEAENPFEKPPAEARKGAIWVKPKLVAQVNFATWTADNLVRQASFKGLREDKAATEVRREEPTVAPRPRGSERGFAHGDSGGCGEDKGCREGCECELRHAPVRLTHPEKILDAETKLTKRQLADYYWAVAEQMLPAYRGAAVVAGSVS